MTNPTQPETFSCIEGELSVHFPAVSADPDAFCSVIHASKNGQVRLHLTEQETKELAEALVEVLEANAVAEALIDACMFYVDE